jgi:hypothetical protein
VVIEDPNRLRVYQGSYSWNHRLFKLEGFYRTGHYHWGYEGDFFGLYPEANYGPNLDIYNGIAPNGFEVEGKKMFEGFKVAYGPQLWWGANPAVLFKYTRHFGLTEVTGIFHQDLDDAGAFQSSLAVPSPRTQRATIHASRSFGKLGVEVGGIWGGKPLVGREFQVVRGTDPTNYEVLQDEILDSDTWGGKVKVTYSAGRFNWYAQGSTMGLVARGGGDATQTFTGWRLKDSGSGNMNNILTGFTFSVGNLQIAPNFMWQKPIVDPIPNDAPAPARLRNQIDDPFVVREGNRETIAGEILFTFDPTPGSWMYAWDSDQSEDAPFAISAGFVFRHMPTTMDASIGFLANRTSFAFPNSVPAQDLWEVHARIVNKLTPDFGFITNVYGGNAQSRGSDERLIERFGVDLRAIYKSVKLVSAVKVNDWGPYDYHKDFNLTYPLQLSADLSTAMGKQEWFVMPNTRIGLMAIWRSLDQYSPRYNPNGIVDTTAPADPDLDLSGYANGSEWEFRTYVHINLGR